MKIYSVLALLLFAGSAVADEATDARIAQLEARIAGLERQIERLSDVLDALVAPEDAAGKPQPRNSVTVERSVPPPAQALSPQDVEQAIRQNCIQRQIYDHAIGGPVGDFSTC